MWGTARLPPSEATFTIRPPAAPAHVRQDLERGVERSPEVHVHPRRKSSRVMASSGPTWMTSATLHSTSMPPKRWQACWIAARTSSGRLTSQRRARASPPRERSSRSACPRSAAVRAQIATRAPASTSWRASTSPSPREPPVTSTALPSKEKRRERRRSAATRGRRPNRRSRRGAAYLVLSYGSVPDWRVGCYGTQASLPVVLQHEVSFCSARELWESPELGAGDALRGEIFAREVAGELTHAPFSQCSTREPRLTRATLKRPGEQDSMLRRGTAHERAARSLGHAPIGMRLPLSTSCISGPLCHAASADSTTR